MVALVDVDPYVLTLQQVKTLADFVASGGGLLFVGGPNTFAASKDLKSPLKDILPVTFEEGASLLTADNTPEIVCDHAAVHGIAGLGKITKLNLLTAKQQSTTLIAIRSHKPISWGWYTGGGAHAAELTRSSDAHSGKASACLELKEFYKDPKTGKPLWIGVALIQGDSDGYRGEKAYPAKPSTTYQFSFWAKGNVPKFHVECLAWKAVEATPAEREHIKTSIREIVPNAEWRKYEGTFTTTATTKLFVLHFAIREDPKTVKLGEKLLIDDVVLTESRKTQNLLTNSGAEDEQARPVLVVGGFHKGRVAVLNAVPDMGQTAQGSFFASDGYDDLLRQLLTWLAGGEQAVWIKEFTPPPQTVHRGETVAVKVALGKAEPVGARVSLVGIKEGKVVARESQVLTAEEDRAVAFQMQLGKDSHADGPYNATVTVTSPLGGALCSRTCSFQVVPPVRLCVEFPYGKAAFAPGSQMRFHVRASSDSQAPLPKAMAVSARILDASGGVVHEFHAPPPLQEATEFQYAIPELEKGEYRVVADLMDGNSQAIESEAKADFSVVDRLDMNEFYPIMSWLGTEGGGQMLDEDGLRERVEDLVAHGFNTVAYGGGKTFATVPLPNRVRLLNFAERYAQSRGMGVIYEYTHFTDIARDRPPEVCPFAPDYAKKFEERFRTDVAVCNAVPRLVSFKILDEPTAGEGTVDFCSHCRAAFKQKYGMALRKLKDIPQDATLERLRHNEFVSDYVSAAYRVGYGLKNSLGGRYGLLLTYMSTIAGSANVDKVQEDGYEWSRYADYLDFDVYPYFYPDSDKVRMVRAHWVFAYLRAVARQWKKPMGFYVELDDRNYPLQINPAKASSECAYTAIGQGCDYLNSFINHAFGTGTGSRPERWEDCGREMRKIASVAPLLKRMHKAPAEVAVYFPHAQWYTQGKSYTPTYAYQLVLRAFGECDVLHEKVFREKGGAGFKVILLLGVDMLPDDCAEKLAAFVRGGGTLIADHIPTRNQAGAECKLSKELFSGEEKKVVGDLKASARKEEQGRVILFSDDVDKLFKESVETPSPPAREALLKTMHRLLAQAGAKAHAWSDNPEFETDVRVGQNSAMLVAINHAAERGRAKVEVGNLGFEPRYVCDLVTGETIPARRSTSGIVLDLELGDRSARLIGFYPEALIGHELEVASPSFQRGGRLKYVVRVKGERTTPAPGHHIVEVTVTDARGIVQPRYGGLLATTDGALVRDVPLAVNADKGQWRITVRDRYTKPNSGGVFDVY
jgi:uncharacterized membrane protein